MAQDFVNKFSITFDLYTDPKKESYLMMGWKRTLGLSLRSFSEGLKAVNKGFRQGSLAGDPWQQGGEAIITREGEIWWSNPINSAGSHSTIEELRALIYRFVKEKGLPQDPQDDPHLSPLPN